MNDIRMCWHPDVTHPESGVFRDGGFWYLESVDMRNTLTTLLNALLATHGTGSHWLEVRPSNAESIPIYH